jgi:predicted O-methyltransferase YrrM
MKNSFLMVMLISALPLAGVLGAGEGAAQAGAAPEGLDGRVKTFLDGARHQWQDWNVAYADGQILHDLVVEKGFKNILEIGTSTGHSTIWLAWAAAKTGGRVITIEIDRGRHETALENFKKAGLDPYIDARLGDAHDLVKVLPGPFDFVFSDADKDWYPQYFRDLDPKIPVNGCFTAHNVLRYVAPGVQEFLDLVRSRPNYRTRIERGGGEGISVSCKTSQ